MCGDVLGNGEWAKGLVNGNEHQTTLNLTLTLHLSPMY